METPGKKDQIYLLMYEKDMAEVLYVLLTGAEYSANFKEKVLKVSEFPCSKICHVSKLIFKVIFAPIWFLVVHFHEALMHETVVLSLVARQNPTLLS